MSMLGAMDGEYSVDEPGHDFRPASPRHIFFFILSDQTILVYRSHRPRD